MKRYAGIAQLLFTGLLLVVAGSAGAQSAAGYPNKPVRIILPYPPGGSASPVVGMYGEKLAKDLGQNFVLDHRGGGGSIIGTTAAAKAAADGYTLFVGSSAVLVDYWLRPDLPYDFLKDFTPIAGLTRAETVLAVHPSVPANDLKEFISYAKANPGKLNAVSTSSLSKLIHLGLMNGTGTKLTIVNYKGGAQAMTDLLSGTVQTFITNVSNVQSLIKAGKLKGFGISGSKRNPVIPDVPTYAEAGLKDYDPTYWLTLFGPGKTPRDIIAKINAQVRKAQEMPEVIGTLDKQGLVPNPMTLAQAETFIRTEAERYGKLIKDSGMKAEDE